MTSWLQLSLCIVALWLLCKTARFEQVKGAPADDIAPNGHILRTRSATNDDAALPPQVCHGSVVLQASGLVKSKPGMQTETLVSLVREMRPALNVEMPSDALGYARIKVQLQDEGSVRELIKDLGRARGKHVNVREVPGTRRYDSPPH